MKAWHWPLLKSTRLPQVHRDAACRNTEPQKRHRKHGIDMSLPWQQVILQESLEDWRMCWRSYVMQHVVEQGKTKGHYKIFIMAIRGVKRCLPFVTFSNSHQTICIAWSILVTTLACGSSSKAMEIRGRGYLFLVGFPPGHESEFTWPLGCVVPRSLRSCSANAGSRMCLWLC